MYLGADLKFIVALQQVLPEPDYQLVTCGDRGNAVTFLESEIRYDLLLIDLEWPATEGLELAQLAHSLRHRKRMPIILVAASGLSSELKTLADKAGVKKCVTKTPVDAVSEAIRELVEPRRRKN